jgi:hypothetical protein
VIDGIDEVTGAVCSTATVPVTSSLRGTFGRSPL